MLLVLLVLRLVLVVVWRRRLMLVVVRRWRLLKLPLMRRRRLTGLLRLVRRLLLAGVGRQRQRGRRPALERAPAVLVWVQDHR
jgi:hypothetical protein